MLFSVIVPVYNVEKYIDECIQSIINQTYQEFELILIDDGSTDKSLQICMKYAEKDKRVKVFHQENSGPSVARNKGIKNAKGQYLIFVDGDDFFINQHDLQNIYRIISKEEKDCYLAPIKYYIDNKLSEHEKFRIDKFLACENIYKELVQSNQFSVSPCLKILKKDLVLKYKIFFMEGILCEDVVWSLHLFRHAFTIGYIPFAYYAYRQNVNNSITNRNYEKIFNTHVQVLNIIIEENKQNQSICKNIEFAYLAYLWCIALSYIPEFSKKNRDEKYNILKPLVYLLDYNFSKKIKILKLLYKIFGLKNLSLLLYKYRKKRDCRNKK